MVRTFRSRPPGQPPSSALGLSRLLAAEQEDRKKEASRAGRLVRILILCTAWLIFLAGLAFILF